MQQKFKIKGYLDAHMMTHSNERPFSCKLCNYKCKTDKVLKQHQNIHTGIKPYECNVCGKKFNNSGSRYRHQKEQHVLISDDLFNLAKNEL